LVESGRVHNVVTAEELLARRTVGSPGVGAESVTASVG